MIASVGKKRVVAERTSTGKQVQKKDALRTLVNVNNIDPACFETADKETFEKYWSKTFIQTTTGENIHNAIASRSGAEQAVKVKASECTY